MSTPCPCRELKELQGLGQNKPRAMPAHTHRAALFHTLRCRCRWLSLVFFTALLGQGPQAVARLKALDACAVIARQALAAPGQKA